MERRIGHDIKNLSRLIDQDLRNNNMNLSSIQCFFISQLDINGGSMNQNQVNKLFLTRRSSITSLINNLEKEEIITKVKDEKDKRLNIISLTEKGYQYSKILESNIKLNEQKLENKLTDDEMNILFNLFDKLYEGLKEGK